VLRDSPNNDEGVIGILKDRTREVINERVKKEASLRRMEQKLLEDIRNQVKEKGGEGVTLSKPTPTLDPPSRDAIQKNSSLARIVEQGDPGSPKVWEAFGKQDTVEGLPANGVEGLSEVQFENSSGSRSPVTSLDNIRGVNEVFCNGTAGDKPRLVLVNQGGNKALKAKGEAFRMNF
jgi:hypothetical protein